MPGQLLGYSLYCLGFFTEISSNISCQVACLYCKISYFSFFIRKRDIGRPKANVAAEFINKRVPGCTVIPYLFRKFIYACFCNIIDFWVFIVPTPPCPLHHWLQSELNRLKNI